jgi:hypothetical protein
VSTLLSSGENIQAISAIEVELSLSLQQHYISNPQSSR